MAWSKTFTGSINNGEPYNEGDQPQREAFNAPFQNTLYLNEKVEEQATTIANQASTIANQGTAITAQGQTLAGHGTTLTNHESRLTTAEEEIKSLEGAGNSFGKLFYNLGSFDTVLSVVGNKATIRRYAIKYFSSKDFIENTTSSAGLNCYATAPNFVSPIDNSVVANNIISAGFRNVSANYQWGADENNTIAISTAGKVILICDTLPSDLLIIYKTSTYYDEEVIAGTPIDTADTTQLEYQREEWKKGLNLCRSYTKGNWKLYPVCYLKPNTTYTMFGKSHDYYAVKVIIGGETLWENDYTHVFGDSFRFTTPATIQEGWQTIEISVNRPNPDEDITDIMLVEGNHAYPYEPYNGKVVHEKDLAPINTSIEDIERRLSEMGFKEGVASSNFEYGADNALTVNSLKKFGNLCLFKFYPSPFGCAYPSSQDGIITIPEGFRPKERTMAFIMFYGNIISGTSSLFKLFSEVYVEPNGEINIGKINTAGAYAYIYYIIGGWETN